MKQVAVNQITIVKNPSQAELVSLDVAKWPTWEKEISVFDWSFPEQEVAYILAGSCIITPEGGQPVSFGKDDLVTFPAGLRASWQVLEPLHKHYQLDGNIVTQTFKRIKAAIGL
jgi:uncharacterized protein